MIDHVYKCDACPKEVRSDAGGHMAPVGWTRVNLTYSAKRGEGSLESYAKSIGIVIEPYQAEQYASIPVAQMSGCDLCEECSPKLAKFFESIGNPLKQQELGLGLR